MKNPDDSLIENIDDWRLHLSNWRWERLTKRNWPLYKISRSDDQMNQLWHMRQAIWHARHGALDVSNILDDMDPDVAQAMEGALDYPAPNDPKILETLYQPDSIPHVQLPEVEDEYNIHRIAINDVTVRYVEDSYEIMMTIEGN